MKAEDIKKVLVLGGGTMGQQIAVASALGGCDVTVYDIENKVLIDSRAGITSLLRELAETGRIKQSQVDTVLPKIFFTTDPGIAADGADIISESIPENPTLKGKVFAEFNELCPAYTIFTTNTSILLPSMIAEATGRPDRFLALHFHNFRVTDVIDVMPHPGTSAETIAAVKQFAKKIGQKAIIMNREVPGYVFNSMLTAFLISAQSLAANGVASAEDIDRAWMGVLNVPKGPFGIMDTVGLETVWTITKLLAHKNNDQQLMKNADFLQTYIGRGELGVKSGKGFYDYPDPLFCRPEFLDPSEE